MTPGDLTGGRIIAGTGTLDCSSDHRRELTQDRGLWIPPGSDYVVEAGEVSDLRLDIVMLPEETGTTAQAAGRDRQIQPPNRAHPKCATARCNSEQIITPAICR